MKTLDFLKKADDLDPESSLSPGSEVPGGCRSLSLVTHQVDIPIGILYHILNTNSLK